MVGKKINKRKEYLVSYVRFQRSEENHKNGVLHSFNHVIYIYIVKKRERESEIKLNMFKI